MMAPWVILLSFGSRNSLCYIKFYICDYSRPVAEENRLQEKWQEIITVPRAAVCASRHGIICTTKTEEIFLCLRC